jgi:FtsP/CotA-like multicopper oxidase with cupredoxin domain
MSDNDDIVQQDGSASSDEARASTGANRREFLHWAFAATSTFAFSSLISKTAGAESNCSLAPGCKAVVGAELTNPGEIQSGADHVLKALVDIRGRDRTITYYNGNNTYICDHHNLRAYEGYKGWSLKDSDRVTPIDLATPGPTFRARVGDTVRVVLLNRVDLTCFPNTPLTGAKGGCLVSTQNGKPHYPSQTLTNPTETVTDTYPNCFRVSSTTNIHWHGTHTNPGGFGDNVLVGVLPNTSMSTAEMIKQCLEAYQIIGDSEPQVITDKLRPWYEVATKNLAGLSALPGRKDEVDRAVHENNVNVEHNEWPQYWPGYYPIQFKLPEYTGKPDERGQVYPVMGQSPGTHWYHAHQHGSTTIQLLNGMAGAFIIEGDYDDTLKKLGTGNIKEKVLVMQIFAETPNLVGGSTLSLTVNGQLQPVISMKPGEVQWWRLVLAETRAHGIETWFFLDKQLLNKVPLKNGVIPEEKGNVPQFRTIARDGVQFAWENYVRHQKDTTFPLAPGNRVDLLVKAPSTPGQSLLLFWPPGPARSKANPAPPPPLKDIHSIIAVQVNVEGTLNGENTAWPEDWSQYPKLPAYLADIDPGEIRNRRTVTFSMDRINTRQPVVKIDNKQFNDGVIDQVMLMGNAEEWTLLNTSVDSVMHPFHIHINPFQIIEVFDPNLMDQPEVRQAPYIWHDVIAIPAGSATFPNGSPRPSFAPGHIKFRSRFVDFSGKFVLHCHILGHEDRGMMQLVEVVDNHTVVHHH